MSDSARVETVRRMFDAFALGRVDEEFLATFIDPKVELFDFPEAPGRHNYRGHDGMRQFMADAAENWKTSSIDVASFREVGDKVLVLGRQRSVGALADVPVENDFGEVIAFEGDLIAEIRMFRDHGEALEAADA